MKNRYDCNIEVTFNHMISFFSEKDYTGEEIKEIGKSLYLNKETTFDDNKVIKDYNIASSVECVRVQKNYDLGYSYSIIEEIEKLEPNWNGYGAEPISPIVIEHARQIIKNLDADVQPEHIYPTGRNSIQFEWELVDGSYLEFEIFGNEIKVLEVPKRVYNKAKEYAVTLENCKVLNKIANDFYEQE